MPTRKSISPETHINTLADSWAQRNRPESMNTDWGQSLLAYGLLSAVKTTRNSAARDYLRRWLTYHLGVGVHVTYFVGSWSIGLLFPEVIEEFPEYRHQLLNLADRIYRFITHTAIRNGDRVILHNVDLPHVYVDTVYYSAPVLAKLGAVLGRNDWRRDAMHQLREHLKLLRDPETGFSIHCQENLSGHRSQGAWARGNGWIAMTCGELLKYLKRDSAEYREVAGILTELLTALLPHQTRSGLWRTIIPDRKAYEETSASAMFLYGMLCARTQGILSTDFDEPIHRCKRGLARYIDSDGKFIGCSEGTWPGTIEYYRSLERGEWWWGTGAYLLALREISG